MNTAKLPHIYNYTPGGVSSALAAETGLYINRASNGLCYDNYGKEYIDFICGYGCVSIGHSNARVNRAVFEQLNNGILFPTRNPIHDKLKQIVSTIFPNCEECITCKSGSEGVLAAVRLARAFTKKNVIIRSGYHGWHDSFISPQIAWHEFNDITIKADSVPGVYNDGYSSIIKQWDGNNFLMLEKIFMQHHDNVAALIIDPIQLREPIKKNLERIINLTHRNNALLILDELKTAFRVKLGGIQELYNIKADITIIGKAIANGFPLSIVMGASPIMNYANKTKIMGTYSGELVSIAASIETMSILSEHPNIEYLNKMGRNLIDGMSKIITKLSLDNKMQVVPYRWDCMPYINIIGKKTEKQLIRKRLNKELVKRGLLFLTNHPNFICLAHTNNDIDKALNIFSRTLKEDFTK